MSTPEEILKKILNEFSSIGYSQVNRYNRFGYIGETENSVFVSREAGEDTKISHDKIKIGIEAVKKNPLVYHSGPGSLRKYGITHINSPIWSILHLVPLSEY